jgi:hypothetical protein
MTTRDDCLDERDRFDAAFGAINGVAECLFATAEIATGQSYDVSDICLYLHNQLLKHAEEGKAAFAEIWAKKGGAA